MNLTPPANAPAWLIDLCPKSGKHRAPVQREPLTELDTEAAIALAKVYLTDSAPEAVEGDAGDQTTYGVAARLRDFGVSAGTALTLMLNHWNDKKAFPPWSVDDLKVKVDNAFDYATGAWGGSLAAAEFGPVDVNILERPKRAETGLLRDLGSLDWRPSQNYLIRDLLNYGMIGLITGNSNAGKSPFALDLAAHVATGRPWHGRKVRKGYVAHISTEGWTGLTNRLEAVRRTYFEPGEEPAIGYAALSLDLKNSGPAVKQIVTAVNESAKRFGLPPALIVIDTLSHALGGGSDSDDDVARTVVGNCRRIVDGTGAAMLLTHHPTKDQSSDFRGSSVWTNDTDIRIRIEVGKAGVRTVTTPRVKESRELDPLNFRIRVVDLGKDNEGDAITSVVVDWTEFDPVEIELPDYVKRAADIFDAYVEEKAAGSNLQEQIVTRKEFLELSNRSPLASRRGGSGENALDRLLGDLEGWLCIRKVEQGQWVSMRVPTRPHTSPQPDAHVPTRPHMT
jgi:hypothetical protein